MFLFKVHRPSQTLLHYIPLFTIFSLVDRKVIYIECTAYQNVRLKDGWFTVWIYY